MDRPRLFSRRNKPQTDTFTYKLREQSRARILQNLTHDVNTNNGSMGMLLEEIAKRCDREYGGCKTKPRGWASYDGPDDAQRAWEHFQLCSDDEAIDFIEMLFQYRHIGSNPQGVVATLNNIFREDGIGYELSPFVVHTTRDPINPNRITQEYEFPIVTQKSNELAHAEIVMPALTLLSENTWHVANGEMLDAHKALREGRDDDAITACGRAFESVLKTICTKKKWAFDPHKDTVARLLDICRDNGLFPPFYVEIFKASGTVRNKLGGHGKGPNPLYQNSQEFVDHMIQTTSAHIILLAKLAQMA